MLYCVKGRPFQWHGIGKKILQNAITSFLIYIFLPIPIVLVQIKHNCSENLIRLDENRLGVLKIPTQQSCLSITDVFIRRLFNTLNVLYFIDLKNKFTYL